MAEKEVKGIKKFFEEFKAFAMRGNVLDMESPQTFPFCKDETVFTFPVQ